MIGVYVVYVVEVGLSDWCLWVAAAVRVGHLAVRRVPRGGMRPTSPWQLVSRGTGTVCQVLSDPLSDPLSLLLTSLEQHNEQNSFVSVSIIKYVPLAQSFKNFPSLVIHLVMETKEAEVWGAASAGYDACRGAGVVKVGAGAVQVVQERCRVVQGLQGWCRLPAPSKPRPGYRILVFFILSCKVE